VTLALKPKRGGFLRPFGCGEFIRDFLLGKEPYGAIKVDPRAGAPQAVIFQEYKLALMRATADHRATINEESRARLEKRKIDEKRIEETAQLLLEGMPYKAWRCRFHSFIVYFSMLRRLGWVELTGQIEPSAFQDHYRPGPPRKYYRLTEIGKKAGPEAWSNPQRALYK
jgi:hypothetical protein